MATKGNRGKNFKTSKAGNLINEHGVWFKPEEKKRLESLVNSVNRKSDRLKKAETEMKMQGQDLTMGEFFKNTRKGHSDMIFNHKSKSLHQFKSRKEYNKYIKALEKMTSRNYMAEVTNRYRDSYLKSIDRNLVTGADNMKDIKVKLKNMKWQDFMKTVQTNPDMSLGYHYEPQAIEQKAMRIRNILGLDEKRSR